jgi:transcriptional repressor NrdR
MRNLEDKVIDSRASKDGSLSADEANASARSFRYTTYEQLESNDLRVVKRMGAREL